MIFHSTKNQGLKASLEEALFNSLPSDNGLYIPEYIPTVSNDFLQNIENLSFNEIASEVAWTLLGDEISREDIDLIVNRSFDFKAPVMPVGEDFVLELFHGPSMAFKDFGARFMASLMSYFLAKSAKEIKILVATSGDTGGAVALGFYKVPGISVTILYPRGKVSEIQERQLTTLGHNITAIEVDGNFDDCQRLVKEAFLDPDLSAKFNLASANSINIARLIPQSFYYFSAYAQLKKLGKPVVFSVPSGNFGNLSAGLLAYRMGLPVDHFIAATNLNNTVPNYLHNGDYEPAASVETISNAMDVGNPSNFVRLKSLMGDDWQKMTSMISGYYFSDEQTRKAMHEVFDKEKYILCPHTSVAYLGLQEYRKKNNTDFTGIFLSTAHPAKFLELVEETLAIQVEIPEKLEKLLSIEKSALEMKPSFHDFKTLLFSIL